jgi:hypothetical protein
LLTNHGSQRGPVPESQPGPTARLATRGASQRRTWARILSTALLGVAVLGAIALAPSAQAATTSGVPTTSTNGPVPKGGTIRIYVNNHGSKIVNKWTSLFRGTQRVRDMSPAPGVYTAKTTIKYRIKTTTSTRVWVADSDCDYYSEEGWDDNGDGDYNDYWDTEPYDGCAKGEFGWYRTKRQITYGSSRKVVRSHQVRVQSDESPGCATFSEYKAVRNGMTTARVQKIVGASGHLSYRFLTPSYSHITREFKLCNGDSWDSMDIELYKYSPRGIFKVEDKGWYSY